MGGNKMIQQSVIKTDLGLAVECLEKFKKIYFRKIRLYHKFKKKINLVKKKFKPKNQKILLKGGSGSGFASQRN
jgi:hypothetical protein